jgi:hypothetical protein
MTNINQPVRVLVLYALAPSHIMTVQGPWSHELCVAVHQLTGAILLRVLSPRNIP